MALFTDNPPNGMVLSPYALRGPGTEADHV